MAGEIRLKLQSVLPPIHCNAWPRDWDRTEAVAVDTEWDPENPDRLLCIGIGNDRWVSQWWWQELSDTGREHLARHLESLVRSAPVIYHAADADIKALRRQGLNITAACHKQLEDTMLAHAVLESEAEHSLEHLSLKYGVLPPYKHLRDEDLGLYNAADVVETHYLWVWHFLPAFMRDRLSHLIYRNEMIRFLDIKIESEELGIAVNAEVAKRLAALYEGRIEQATRIAHAYCGWPVNLGSPAQVKAVCYGMERMPVQRSHKEPEKATTNKDALATLRRLMGTEWDAGEEPTLEDTLQRIENGGHPFLEARALYYGAQQALSHYVRPCLGVERIYPECRQHVQASGRHSYVGPAVQQFRGPLLDLLVPDPGMVWVGHDWKQIEVRILAYEAGDEPYIRAFERGDDIHELNARAIFGPPGSPDLEAIRRRFVKAFVFRLHYRGRPENAGDIPGARILGLNEKRLIEASERYLAAHPALPAYWAKIEAEAKRTGVVRTFLGRPRRLTSPYRSARMREACNHPMQGGVADIYITTALAVKEAAPWARLVYGAHDSQWWEMPGYRREEFEALYRPIVEREYVIRGRRVRFPADYKYKERP